MSHVLANRPVFSRRMAVLVSSVVLGAVPAGTSFYRRAAGLGLLEAGALDPSPDAPLLALCAKLRAQQAEWQRLWAATPDTGDDTPADAALEQYSDFTWPGIRASADGQDLPSQLLSHRATTPEGRQAKAVAVLAMEEAGLYCDSRDDSVDLMLDVLCEAAGSARLPIGDDITPIAKGPGAPPSP